MKGRLVIAALCLGFCAGSAAATPLKLPPTTRARLGNGLTILVVPTDRIPLVSFRLVAQAGSVDDPVGKEGLAALTATMLTQGAGPRDARQVAEEIAFVGGTLGASADVERTIVACEVLKKDFDLGLGLFRDVIVSPRFAEGELGRKRDETLAEIASGRNDPATVADVALDAFLLGGSRLAHPVLGFEASVEAITREDVAAFHARTIRPERSILAVVGDVQPATVIAALQRAFAGWKPAGSKTGPSYDPVPQVKGRKVQIVNKPEVTQAQVRLACIGVPRNHPDHFPILVANAILSGGFSSRLVNEVRVNQGLAYGIESGFSMMRNAGVYGIESATRVDAVRRLVDASLAQVRTLATEEPTQAELDRAIRLITGLYPLGLQAPDHLAARLLDAEFYGLGASYLESFPDRVRAVTMTDVRRALKSYFCTDDLRIVVVADPKAVRAQLEGLGPVEVVEPR